MIKCLFFIIAVFLFNSVCIAQTQVKYVVCNGGNISQNNGYTSFSVVGQLAASKFVNGSYSGTIGYLDDSDNDPSSIQKVENTLSGVNIYPNPTNADVFIEFVDDINDLFVVVTNISGQIVFQRKYPKIKEKHIVLSKQTFDVPGIYNINMDNGKKHFSSKIIVIK